MLALITDAGLSLVRNGAMIFLMCLVGCIPIGLVIRDIVIRKAPDMAAPVHTVLEPDRRRANVAAAMDMLGRCP